MAVGDNNPRVFADTIALDAWRTKFDGERGEADLHIEVMFSKQGRVGGPGAPVRFKLALKRAEVHVIRDSEGIIDINRASVQRTSLPEPSTRRRVAEKKTEISGEIGGDLSPAGAIPSAKAKAGGGLKITDTLEHTEQVSAMRVKHWPTATGYAFKIEPTSGGRLDGQPWAPNAAVMKIKDTNSKRRGEPPEIRVEIHCLREDLIISSVQFTDSSFPSWATLPKKKRIVVEQYLKDELERTGMSCGNISEQFARIILADAMPSVEL